MKNLKTNTIKMIVAIILLVTVNTAFAQNYAPSFIEKRNSVYPNSKDELVVVVNRVSVDFVIPLFEGVCDLEYFDVTIVDANGRRIYLNQISYVPGKTISIPISNYKSNILILTISGKNYYKSCKFYVG